MKKLIIILFSIFISINSYGGIFSETICFETDGQNIVFLPNDINSYTGKYLCKYDNGQKEKECTYKHNLEESTFPKYHGLYIGWHKNGNKSHEVNYFFGYS